MVIYHYLDTDNFQIWLHNTNRNLPLYRLNKRTNHYPLPINRIYTGISGQKSSFSDFFLKTRECQLSAPPESLQNFLFAGYK